MITKVGWDTSLAPLVTPAPAQYVVLDTDYTTRALVCSCRDLHIPFFRAHRRTCELLVVGERTGDEQPANIKCFTVSDPTPRCRQCCPQTMRRC